MANGLTIANTENPGGGAVQPGFSDGPISAIYDGGEDMNWQDDVYDVLLEIHSTTSTHAAELHGKLHVIDQDPDLAEETWEELAKFMYRNKSGGDGVHSWRTTRSTIAQLLQRRANFMTKHLLRDSIDGYYRFSSDDQSNLMKEWLEDYNRRPDQQHVRCKDFSRFTRYLQRHFGSKSMAELILYHGTIHMGLLRWPAQSCTTAHQTDAL